MRGAALLVVVLSVLFFFSQLSDEVHSLQVEERSASGRWRRTVLDISMFPSLFHTSFLPRTIIRQYLCLCSFSLLHTKCLSSFFYSFVCPLLLCLSSSSHVPSLVPGGVHHVTQSSFQPQGGVDCVCILWCRGGWSTMTWKKADSSLLASDSPLLVPTLRPCHVSPRALVPHLPPSPLERPQ